MGASRGRGRPGGRGGARVARVRDACGAGAGVMPAARTARGELEREEERLVVLEGGIARRDERVVAAL